MAEAVRITASATTTSAAAMVMTKSGSDAAGGPPVGAGGLGGDEEDEASAEDELDADEEQDGVAPHRDPEDPEPDEDRREEVGTGEVDHARRPPHAGCAETARAATRATRRRSSERSSKGQTHVPNSCPATWVVVTSARSTGYGEREQDGAEERRDGRSEDGRADGAPRPGRCGEVGTDGGAGQHEGEEDEDDDRADVDEDEDEGDELGPEDEQRPGDPEEGDDEPQGRVDDVAGRDGEEAADHGEDRGGRERRVECRHVSSPRAGRVGASSGTDSGCRRLRAGGGTVRSRQDRCRGLGRARRASARRGRAARRPRAPARGPRQPCADEPGAPGRLVRRGDLGRLGRTLVEGGRGRDGRHPVGQPALLVEQVEDVETSAYSNCGLQWRASNGQTSMQIPQYMHSEKSMAKRSRTLRWRSRPPSVVAGIVSLWESM